MTVFTSLSGLVLLFVLKRSEAFRLSGHHPFRTFPATNGFAIGQTAATTAQPRTRRSSQQPRYYTATSSRHVLPPRNDFYDDDIDQDGFYRDDDDMRRRRTPQPPTRQVGNSRAAQELQNIPLASSPQDDDDLWYDDSRSSGAPLSQRKPLGPRGYEEDDDDFVDDDWDYDDEVESSSSIPSTGNFWSNPKASLDPLPPPSGTSSKSPRRGSYPPSTAAPHERDWSQERPTTRRPSMNGGDPRRRSRKRKTTFRSGTPPPPEPVLDLYNRLFWYGVDDDDDDGYGGPQQSRGVGKRSSRSPADPTMFGGTKGKFNGLQYIREGVGVMPPDERTRRPRGSLPSESSYLDDDEYDDDWEEEDGSSSRNSGGRDVSLTPPFDIPRPRGSSPTQIPFEPTAAGGSSSNSRDRYDDWDEDDDNPWGRRQGQRRRRRRQGSGDDDWFSGGGGGVSSWFRSDDDEIDYSGGRGRQSQRRGRDREPAPPPFEQQRPEWSPLNALDTFMGLNRDRLDTQALDYDRRMGLSSFDEMSDPRDTSRRARRRRSPQRSPRGRADEDYDRWLYDHRDDVYDDDFYDVIPGDRRGRLLADPKKIVHDVEFEKEEIDTTDSDSSKNSVVRRTLSWEERSLAMERVPPPDIPAWGPSGDLGVDARAKAITDALQDVLEAERTVESREARIAQAREELTILRVDERLERNRMEASEARMRDIHQKIEHASRNLRYAQLRLESAHEELADVEARHWALLRLCDPDQVESNVNEILREVEELDPARHHREKIEKNDKNQPVTDTPISNNMNNEATGENPAGTRDSQNGSDTRRSHF